MKNKQDLTGKAATIYILTAVHNEIEDTKKLLKSIFKQTFNNFEVYLVDDGSTDGTTEFISEKYPTVKILKGNGNLWWTGSLNLGLKNILQHAKEGDYVWTINNDCYFSKEVLSNIYKFASRHEKYLIGSEILDSKTKKISDKGVKINWDKLTFESGGTDALSTKGTLYPVGVFKDIGLFDAKHFPHYFSDYEFSIHAKRNGYELAVCSESKIFNRSERTGSSKLSFSTKSKINPFLQLKIIRFACPPKYRLRCYFLLISKLFRGKK